MINIIEEFMVSLGFVVDKKSLNDTQKTVERTITGMEKVIQSFQKALADNKAFQAIKQNFDKAIGWITARVTAFLATTTGLITAGIAVVVAAVVAAGAIITAILTKIMGDAAKADLKAQLLARRLFTTVENARSLMAVMKQMDVNSLEGLNDIALNPELRKQFLELREIAKDLSLNDEQSQGFKNIRAVGLEFQKLGLIMDYFWQRLGGDLGALLEGPLKGVKEFMAGFNDFLKSNLPQVSHAIAAVVGIAGNLLAILTKITGMGLILKIPAVAEALGSALQGVDDQLSLINAVLSLVNRMLDNILNLINRIFEKVFSFKPGDAVAGIGGDMFKTGQDAIGKIADYTQKIFDLLSQVWNFFGSVLRPIKAWMMDQWEKIMRVLNAFLGGTAEASTSGASNASPTKNPLNRPVDLSKIVKPGTTLSYLLDAAKSEKLRVTSTTGGHHNPGSVHPFGEAIDVDHRTMPHAKAARLRAMGIKVVDETVKPEKQKVWGGPHFHLEFRAAQLAQKMQEMHRRATVQGAVTQQEKAPESKASPVNQQGISIHINGYNRDPSALAMEISRTINTLTGRDTRGLQSQIV